MHATNATCAKIGTRLTNSRRSGAATVEFAVCLPFLLAIVFGSIEAANAVYLQEALTSAAYEGCNVASAVGGTSAVATARAQGVLTLLGVKTATVSISPAVDANTPTGTAIVVTCSAPLGSNTATGWCLGNRKQTATFTTTHL